ncbi:hypothetical protein N7451_001561 [Penicillium sp. IBT 35674x]|nr:hypothetical protein N7451_001561 [Penicillium sp. IBT 35674x]
MSQDKKPELINGDPKCAAIYAAITTGTVASTTAFTSTASRIGRHSRQSGGVYGSRFAEGYASDEAASNPDWHMISRKLSSSLNK